MSDKIQARHLERKAYVHVRQSTAKQVYENSESTTRQYALAERARSLGWSQGGIEIIDEDLGRSGTTTENRSGFSCLSEAVARGEVGAIFALEISRLARCSQDWQRLLALCAVAEVAVVDEQAIYDPRNGDDKLLLDFKGTMSEAELRWLSLRLRGAQNNLAKRGELRFTPPTGFVWSGHGFGKGPDLAVQRRRRMDNPHSRRTRGLHQLGVVLEQPTANARQRLSSSQRGELHDRARPPLEHVRGQANAPRAHVDPQSSGGGRP